jgi:hypothetical protein
MFRKLILAALVVPLSACQAGTFASTPTPASTPTETPISTPTAIAIALPDQPTDINSLPQSEISDLAYYDQTLSISKAAFNRNNQGFSLITDRPDLALKQYIEPNSLAVVGTRIDEQNLKEMFGLGDNPDNDGLYHGQFNGKEIVFSSDLKAIVDKYGRPIFR